MIINSGAIQNPVPNFAYFEYNNPSAVSGYGSYVVAVEGNATLAAVRALDSLVVYYETAGGVNNVVSAIGSNTNGRTPVAQDGAYAGTICQSCSRLTSDGNPSMAYTAYAISDTTKADVAENTDSGRIHITEGGDLRIYGNTTAYPIPAGKIRIFVWW